MDDSPRSRYPHGPTLAVYALEIKRCDDSGPDNSQDPDAHDSDGCASNRASDGEERKGADNDERDDDDAASDQKDGPSADTFDKVARVEYDHEGDQTEVSARIECDPLDDDGAEEWVG